MTETDKIIFEEIKADHEYIIKIRRDLHKSPEIAKEEFKTAERIEKELEQIGLEHKRVGETGVYAEIHGEKEKSSSQTNSVQQHNSTLQRNSAQKKNSPQKEKNISVAEKTCDSKKSKTIILRADIDALPIQETHECEYMSQIPGRMHACGHDSHTASLIGAARILNRHKDLFSGTVRLTFQSGEEIGYGARVFVKSGLLDGADRCFGMHTAPDVRSGKIAITPGPNNASVDWFKITVKGHPAHVATPQFGADAVYIASQITVAAQALITRRISPTESVIIGIGKITAGDAYNIVAQKAELEGTIRTLSPQIRSQVKTQLKKLAENIAESFGGTAEIEFQDFTSPLINDEISAEEAQKTAERIFGKDAVIKNRRALLTGDDFAEYILKVPGVYAYFGTGNPKKKETTVAYHDSNFDIDEDAMIQSVSMYTFYAIDFLNT